MPSRFVARTIVAGCALASLIACGTKHAPVTDLSGHEDLELYKLQSVAGTRDGDQLHARAMFSDSSSILTAELHFAVGAPTSLRSGAWRWVRNGQQSGGAVAARSVTFLSGQDGPPSIGGTFDLLDDRGEARYRVNIPVTELKTGWKG